jgi:putative membrane protein
MERPQNINHTNTTIAVILVILFHLVGLIGLSVNSFKPLFLQIVPWHLLLMMLILFFSHKRFNTKFILFAILIFITGFFAEWVGVHTGGLFGNYTYGKTLGIKFSNIPLIIGANWFLLIYATGVLMQRSRIKSLAIRLLTGAMILVLLDRLIEPAAINFDYWHWASNTIPAKNYACWLLVSAVMLFVFEKFKFEKQNIVAPVLLITQFIFFIALLLIA